MFKRIKHFESQFLQWKKEGLVDKLKTMTKVGDF